MRKHGRGRQPLTTVDVEKLREPGRYGDGQCVGLYLAVSPTRAKSWLFIGTLHAKRHVVGIGSADTVTLAAARAKAAKLREQLKQGIAPIKAKEAHRIAKAQRAAADADAVTFGTMAEELFQTLFRSWKSRKHEQQWRLSLDTYCAPLWHLPVSKIAVADVLQVVGPLWSAKTRNGEIRTRATATIRRAGKAAWRHCCQSRRNACSTWQPWTIATCRRFWSSCASIRKPPSPPRLSFIS